MTDAGLWSDVVAAGTAAGLDRIGRTTAEPFLDARAALVERREAGLAADMAFTYRNPDRSTDPRRTLPSANSLVVAALGYRSEPPAPPDRLSMRVARYATDAHYDALRDGLRAIAEVLQQGGFSARVVADDNALVDRAAAHRAGLGWFGKNANLLTPGAGSWFVLGSVITDAVLVENPTEPVADGCGTCTLCMTSCPTDAIVAHGVIDARRCLAWLLQAGGSIPDHYREAIGDRLYGCDDCQEVCPPNRVQHLRYGSPPTGEDPGAWIDLEWVLSADDDSLLQRLGRFYVARRDPNVWRRNALVAAGNAAEPPEARVVALLNTWADGEDEILAEHAHWALERHGLVH